MQLNTLAHPSPHEGRLTLFSESAISYTPAIISHALSKKCAGPNGAAMPTTSPSLPYL